MCNLLVDCAHGHPTSYDSEGEARIELAKEKKGDAEKAKQRDVAKAIALEKKLASAEGKCW